MHWLKGDKHEVPLYFNGFSEDAIILNFGSEDLKTFCHSVYVKRTVLAIKWEEIKGLKISATIYHFLLLPQITRKSLNRPKTILGLSMKHFTYIILVFPIQPTQELLMSTT